MSYEPGEVLETLESLPCHSMIGDNGCDGLKKGRIRQSAAKPSLKRAGSSTTRKSTLRILRSMRKFPRAPGLTQWFKGFIHIICVCRNASKFSICHCRRL